MALARISHRPSAATPETGSSEALSSGSLFDVPSGTTASSSSCAPWVQARLRHPATAVGEESGPGGGLLAALRQITTRLSAWDRHREALAASVPSATFYLGGDGLRPYVCFQENGRVSFVGVKREGLPLPTLVAEVIGGTYGDSCLSKEGSPTVYSLTVPVSDALTRRLEIPSALLVGLGHPSRYRAHRLPLGVARLAQWLRFSHAAHVEVIDYSLTDDAEAAVASRLAGADFDLLGISVNFGQWQMLADLAAVVNGNPHRPVIALGNILAAFSPIAAADLFPHGPVFIATGLGERPLEQLCRHHRQLEALDRIPGLLRADRETAAAGIQRAEPPALVFPEDGLVLEVAARAGQVSLETSFGCQYGKCTFCPRSHRGEGWRRGDDAAVVAVLERLSMARPDGGAPPVVSFVDEDFFGSEGLADPPDGDRSSAGRILDACCALGIEYELYTRLEQLFDRRRSLQWNFSRARLLATNAPKMRRVFVGVESGSPAQLRRYGKGQSVGQTIDSLRIASMLRVPLEFGFITFDPLLSAADLVDNITFLGRRDILMAPGPDSLDQRLALVEHYLGGGELVAKGSPLYTQVAYMATELEVLAQSSYAAYLQRRHPELLDGSFDPNFARFGTHYQDRRIAEVAGWCRVWTEGMFSIAYQARMIARGSHDREVVLASSRWVGEYRAVTFGILLSLARAWMPEIEEALGPVVADGVGTATQHCGKEVRRDPLAYLQHCAAVVSHTQRLWLPASAQSPRIQFDPHQTSAHRAS